MNTTFDVLVIVLSSLLGIFLILAVITTVVILKLVGSLRNVVAKGEHLVDTAVDSAEGLSEAVRKNANAINLLKIITNVVGKAKRK